MENFNERLEHYYNKLRENPDLVNNIIKNSKDQQSLNILLGPRTDRELLLAESTFRLMEDMLSLTEKAYFGEVKYIDVKNSRIANIYINIINALKSNNLLEVERMKKHLIEDFDVKETASLIYELLVIFSQDADDFISVIMERCGFDDNDDLSDFKFYLSEANKITNADNRVDLDRLEPNDDKKFHAVLDFSNEFHKLYEEGLVKNPELGLHS